VRRVRLTNREWHVMRLAVLERDGECCVFCGNLIDPAAHWECHHRRLRSQEGGDVIENLIALHKGCHEYVHRNATEWSYSRGFLVPGVVEPALWRVLYHRTWWRQPSAVWTPAEPLEFQRSLVDAWNLNNPVALATSDPFGEFGAWDR